MKILIVGGGSMGQAFVRGILSSTDEHICAVVERDFSSRGTCENLGAKVFPSVGDFTSSQLIDALDAIVIAVKPNDIKSVSSEINKMEMEKCLILSIAAGVTVGTLESYFKGFSVVRAMPNIAASQLLSATAMCVAQALPEHHMSTASAILDLLGTTVHVQEDQMDLVTAISGSGPAYFFYLAELLMIAAKENGMNAETAQQLISQTFLGAATMAKENGSFSFLRQRVTSPGGTTQAALKVFENNEMEDIVKEAISAATARSIELSGKGSGKVQQ